MSATHGISVRAVDLTDAKDADDWLDLLDHYARDPMGGAHPLSDYARGHLVSRLLRLPSFNGALAYDAAHGERPAGLVNAFLGFSTFAARPLLNIHDLVVREELRGRGVGQALLAWTENRARELGCCKLTLEVLSNNQRAMRSYERAGFAPYTLDPAAGQAIFLQKIIEES